MELLYLFLVFISLTFADEVNVKDQVFCAMDQLADLVRKQESILNDLIELNKNYTTDSGYFSRKLKLWKSEQLLAQRDVTKYITNPLNAYVLIKRTSAELKLIEKYLSPDLKEELQKLWEYKEDIVGATEGLFRLQVTYRISSRDFSNGVIMGKRVRNPLSAHDLFSIGVQALNLLVEWKYPRSEDFFAIEYLQMALNKIANGEDPDEEVDREILVFTLSEVYERTGQYKKAADVAEFLFRKDQKFVNLRNKYMGMLDTFGLSKVYVENPYNEEIISIQRFNWKTDEIYTNQACRGERVLSIQEQSKLRCRYISNSPFSKIGPFRVEELYQDPLVHLYYDVIFDNEIEVVKNISSVKLERGKNYLGGNKEGYTNRRITKTAFCSDHEDEVFEKLGRRVTDMTGLTSMLKKELQVQNYGVAGFIHAHWDNHLPGDVDPYKEWGNRFATALFYLSDVEIGGYTVFPYIGVRADPIKGTAIFWYSVKASGEPEFLMRHASCPVLLGSKWVANRWIYEKGNEFIRKCPSDSYTGIHRQHFFDEFF